MSKNFSHAACSHPSTKVARAKCRREMARSIASLLPSIESPIITAWESMKSGPLELTAAPARTEITSDTWRDHKGETASVDLIGETIEGEITGWSAKNIQVKVDGKTVRHPVSIVIRATV